MATTTKQHSHRLGSIWVEPGTAVKLDRLSAETGKSINEIVRAAIDSHLRAAERRKRSR